MNTTNKPQKTVEGYYYDAQIKRFLTQFMSIFSGLRVRTGKREDVEYEEMEVPIVYGSKDRVAAAILAGNTQNKPIRLPTMSAYMSDLAFAANRNAGAGVTRSTPFLPQGGILPNDVKVIHQIRPIPYDLRVDLSIYTSNMDQHFQILEQILMLFNPTIQIQTSDAQFDATKIVSVELDGINFNENYPSGVDRRKIQTTLSFIMPVWIAPPAEERANIVQRIMMRIHTGTFEDFVIDSANGLDSEYEEYASSDPLRGLGSGEG